MHFPKFKKQFYMNFYMHYLVAFFKMHVKMHFRFYGIRNICEYSAEYSDNSFLLFLEKSIANIPIILNIRPKK